jgi:tetratricopeptide (TPR) repeat protein
MASRLAPQHFGARLVQAVCQENLARPDRAEELYTICLALKPGFVRGYLGRGLARLGKRDWRPAEQDFTRVLKERPDLAEAYIYRAAARQEVKDDYQAIRDLDKAIAAGLTRSAVYYRRAELLEGVRREEEAARDYRKVLQAVPADAQDWLYRALARPAADTAARLADLEKALELDPRCLPALRAKADLLANHLNRWGEAAQVLDRFLHLSPRDVEARLERALLSARLGQRSQARQTAERIFREDNSPQVCYKAAVIYAATSQDDPYGRSRAVKLLSSALARGYGLGSIAADADLAPLRGDPEFQGLLLAARLLGAGTPWRMRVP